MIFLRTMFFFSAVFYSPVTTQAYFHSGTMMIGVNLPIASAAAATVAAANFLFLLIQ